ncbi:MAG TPA: hypothetical protein VJ836_03645 [Candidatus Saccharimonadales bacterium]|nr:hypothetical protein [Candidatus Saccharimonadales bacterium]
MACKHNLQPLLDTRQNQLNLIFSASNGLDAKALALLAFDSAILIFALETKTPGPWWVLSILFISFTASIIVAAKAIWPRDYAGAGVDIDKHPEYLNMSDKLILTSTYCRHPRSY